VAKRFSGSHEILRGRRSWKSRNLVKLWRIYWTKRWRQERFLLQAPRRIDDARTPGVNFGSDLSQHRGNGMKLPSSGRSQNDRHSFFQLGALFEFDDREENSPFAATVRPGENGFQRSLHTKSGRMLSKSIADEGRRQDARRVVERWNEERVLVWARLHIRRPSARYCTIADIGPSIRWVADSIQSP